MKEEVVELANWMKNKLTEKFPEENIKVSTSESGNSYNINIWYNEKDEELKPKFLKVMYKLEEKRQLMVTDKEIIISLEQVLNRND